MSQFLQNIQRPIVLIHPYIRDAISKYVFQDVPVVHGTPSFEFVGSGGEAVTTWYVGH
jgi:hypothetical protein